MSTPIADMVAIMLSGGIPPEMIVLAVRTAEVQAQTLCGGDPAAARRRAYDRERKARQAAAKAEIPQPIKVKKERSPTPPKEILPTQEEEAFKLEIEKEGSSSGIRARARPACRLPEGWAPTLDDLVFARTLLPSGRELLEIEKFRDYWHARAGPHAVKRDWSAAWRSWCRKAVEMSGGGNGTHRQTHGNGSQRAGGFSGLAGRLARSGEGGG